MAYNSQIDAYSSHNYHNRMTIETKSADRAEARRYLNHANIEFSESLDGFEIDTDHLPDVRKVLEDRLIIYVVNTGEML